ncbi:methyltransferase [Bdellovibrionota bacterium FG-2]
MDLGLKRYPPHSKETLQAWDSADELILEHLSQLELKGKKILIIHDQFGALSCSLKNAAEALDVTTYTDSYLSFKAMQLNSEGRVHAFNELKHLAGPYDLVLIRVPKNMSYFEDILCHLSGHLPVNSKVICGYMIKHQAKASFELLNRIIGETTTSLAQKKARLILAAFERKPAPSPYPLHVRLEQFQTPFVNHSNLFSREKLDIGTRFLLDHLPRGSYQRILDLGCANGIIGIAAKQLNSGAHLIFTDESQMAIQSAMANYQSNFSDDAEFHWTHCFESQTPCSVDLVLCNPPFHQGTTMGDLTARQMFTDAHQALAPGGLLRVIGNTHLRYQNTLKQIFGNSQRVATHQKFTIVDAVK